MAVTLDRIHNDYSNTYFCQVSKWGKDLTEEDAVKVGLLQKASGLETKTASKLATQTTSKLATPPLKTPTKRRRTRNNNNNNKGSKPINNDKEGIE